MERLKIKETIDFNDGEEFRDLGKDKQNHIRLVGITPLKMVVRVGGAVKVETSTTISI